MLKANPLEEANDVVTEPTATMTADTASASASRAAENRHDGRVDEEPDEPASPNNDGNGSNHEGDAQMPAADDEDRAEGEKRRREYGEML